MTETPSYNSILYWDPAGATTWAKIGQTQDLEGPGASRNAEEVTHRDRGSYWIRKIPGMITPGQMTFTVVWDYTDSAHTGSGGTGLLESMSQAACTIPAWKLDLAPCSGTAYYLFDGFVGEIGNMSPIEGAVTVDVTVEIDGQIQFVVS